MLSHYLSISHACVRNLEHTTVAPPALRRQPNWLRQGAWAAVSVACLPVAEALHRSHTHHLQPRHPRAQSSTPNPYSRPWLMAGAHVEGALTPAAPPVKRDTWDTSQVDWAAIDWSKVSFAEIDWTAIDYSNTFSAAKTITLTQVATPEARPAANPLRADQFGAGNNVATVSLFISAVPPLLPSPTTLQTLTMLQAGVADNVVQAATTTSATSSASPFAPAPTTSIAVQPESSPASQIQIGAGPNSVSLRNFGSSRNLYAFFANAGQYQPTFGSPYAQFELQAGQSQLIRLPAGWSGRVQEISGQVADPATWAEFTFNGYLDLTFFDVSYIRGYNAAVLMQAADGSASSGSSDDFVAKAVSRFGAASSAPDAVVTTDTAGQTVLAPTEPYSGGTNTVVVSFLRSMLGPRQAYVQNFDNEASIATADHNLVITFS